jgi:hypothetical protein
MILLVSGATVATRRYQVGELIVPAARNFPDQLKLVPGKWACDNGAYSGFDVRLFVEMLEWFYRRPGCRFVAAPDAVGDAHQTMSQWPFWARLIRGIGFPPALVAQDGLTVDDVPWTEIAALFIGGHTEWKLGEQARTLVAYAKSRGLWVHMGRVNTRRRIWDATRMGCDSYDGSGFSRWPDIQIPKGLRWASELQPRLDV